MSYKYIIALYMYYQSIDVVNVLVNTVVHGKSDRCHKRSELTTAESQHTSW
jgi:hypothetical protein